MNEVDYIFYIRDAKKADELHALIQEIAKEEGWVKGIPEEAISSSKLHAYAKMKGIITLEERNLLRRFYR